MAGNLPIASSKIAIPSVAPSAPLISLPGLAPGDQVGQRRSGGSGSFGAGASSRATGTPRNSQGQRKQNKSSKRYQRFADEDAMAETAAIRSSSSRKGQTSITHLMNFSLPPRPQHHLGSSSYSHGRQQQRRQWGLGSGYHAVDKARYVHANYRFVVDPRGDYRAQSVDADVHLDWNQVLQILVSSKSQVRDCPICLGHPVAPRMSKCGHVACLTCLLRYKQADDVEKLHGKGPKWIKCPICEDSIYISETRPVRWFAGQEIEAPREGEDVVLRLVLRPAGSTLALPRDGAASLSKDEDIPWYFGTEVMDYSRVMKGTEDYITEQFDSEIRDIEAQEKEDDLMYGDDTGEWARRAVRMIREAKEKLRGIGNGPTIPSKPAEPRSTKAPIEFNTSGADVPDMYGIRNAVQSGQSVSDASSEPNGKAPQLEPETSTTSTGGSQALNTNKGELLPSKIVSGQVTSPFRTRQQQQQGHTAPSEYYFYQALLHYYLSPLDIRILKDAFGNFAQFPSTILPRVERVSTGHIVDDELRRRVKYLAHLPYGCEVSFLECDWTDTVQPEILERFKKEIDGRRKRNQDKEARDEKARVSAEAREEQRYAFARRRRGVSPERQRFAAEDFQPLAADSGLSSSAEQISTSPPWSARRQGSQYASLASPGTSPSASRTVWGTPAVTASSPSMEPVAQPQEPRDDGWIQNWEEMLLQDDSLVAQAQSLSMHGESSTTGAGGGGGAKKKKKAKKITLMSTNVRRGA